ATPGAVGSETFTTVCAPPVLNEASPAYSAFRVALPTRTPQTGTETDAVCTPPTFCNTAAPSAAPLFEKLTLPVGVPEDPLAAVTVAVSVMVSLIVADG